MKVNKILPEYSINKIWDKFSKMNGAVIEFLPENWIEGSEGIFSNTVSYRGFSEDMTADIDIYDDGNLTDTQISEYNDAITDFYINDDSVVAYASSKPTQPIKIILRGEFALESINDLVSDNSDAFDPDKSYKKDECTIHDNIVYRFTADKDPGEWDPYIVEATSIMREVSRCFQSVSNGKALLASAITDKRIPTDARDTFQQMKENIDQIVLGSGNATVGDVLSGKTFTNDDGIEYTGEMPNIGDIDDAISSNYVSNGSHGTGIYARMNPGAHVTLASSGFAELFIPQDQIASMFSATAEASLITKGYTAWVNGVKITGTRPLPVGYQSGSVTVFVDTGATASYKLTFPEPFESVPAVSVGHNQNTKYSSWAGNVTTTGCTLYVSSQSSVGRNVVLTWTAYA